MYRFSPTGEQQSPYAISWDGQKLSVPSYFGKRRQGIYFESTSEQPGWKAVSTVAINLDADGQPLPVAVQNMILKAGSTHLFISYRITRYTLEVYCRLQQNQINIMEDNSLCLDEVGKRLVTYLAHLADRLDFEFHAGDDRT